MRAFERFVRWNVSDNVKVAVCVSVIMAMSVAPHVGACYAVCVAGPAPASKHLTAMHSLQGKSQSLVKASLRKKGRSLFARPSSAPKARRSHRDWAWHPQMTAVTTKHEVRRRRG